MRFPFLDYTVCTLFQGFHQWFHHLSTMAKYGQLVNYREVASHEAGLIGPAKQ
jgi:hypothetical protein